MKISSQCLDSVAKSKSSYRQIDAANSRSNDIKLDVIWRNDFQRGREETFPCNDLTQDNKMNAPCIMELWRDSSGGHFDLLTCFACLVVLPREFMSCQPIELVALFSVNF